MVRLSHAVAAGVSALVLVALLAFLAGWNAALAFGASPFSTLVASSLPSDAQAPEDVRESFVVFWDVWQLVEEEFYRSEPLDQQQMVYGAIRGMLQSLDDNYTIFQEPEDAQRSRESMEGSFEGIGVYMRFENDQVIISRPIKGAPAMEAGLQNEDVILAVDGEDLSALVAGRSEAEATSIAARLIRGPKDSAVTLTIFRPATDETFDVAITRGEIPLISVYSQMLDNGVAYIQLTEFKATTTIELDEALRALLPQNPTSLVLDLRDNPGGFLTTSQEVLGRFYTGVALYEKLSDGTLEEFRTLGAPAETEVFDLPMVVLVNGNSASAAEIVAGALADERPNTTLIGETSFGKGSVQNIHQLRDGSSTRITIAHWFTPDQHEIHEIGVTPDHIVLPSDEPQYAVPCIEDRPVPPAQDGCHDAQLLSGLRLLTVGELPPTPVPEPAGSGSALPVG